MKSNLALTLSLLSLSVTQAQTDWEIAEYPEWADKMTLWGYGWESFTVETEDGFILTTFRLTEKLSNPDRQPNPDYKPVILVNGYECDALSWFPDTVGDTLPTAMHLFDDGFDVYLMSNRATKYCMTHMVYTVDQFEFWAWSFAEMGIYDDKANLYAVKERSGSDKVSFLGYSMGSQHLLYALAEIEDEIADDLHTVALFAPCTLQVPYVSDDVFNNGINKFWDDEIYNLGGPPNWWSTLDFICENYPEDVCNYASGYGYAEPVSVLGEMYGNQQTQQDRFQEYAPNYTEGEMIKPLIPLENIKRVPITFWQGLLDHTCSYEKAVEAANIIGDMVVQFNTVPTGTHQIWGRPLEEPLYSKVKQALIDPYVTVIEKQ